MKNLKFHLKLALFLRIMEGLLSIKNKTVCMQLLAKNNTPIRSRIRLNQAPVISTPINELKISTVISNNQNQNSMNKVQSGRREDCIQGKKKEQAKSESCGLLKKLSFGECKSINTKIAQLDRLPDNAEQLKANLKPILQLNKKMTHQHQVSKGISSSNTLRSLTPKAYKRTQLPKKISYLTSEGNNYSSAISNLVSPLNNNNLKQSSSNGNLRTSNSFTNLFEKRSKTPNRLGSMAFSSLSRKTNPSPSLKQSTSLAESSRLYTIQIQPSSSYVVPHSMINQSNQQNSLLVSQKLSCLNHPAKTAKYKVKTCQMQLCISNQQDEESLVFCSKCAIDLVQKGFTVDQFKYCEAQQSKCIFTSPRENPLLRESKSVSKKNFLSFKSSFSSQMLQSLKTAQRLKQQIRQQIELKQKHKQMLQNKVLEETSTIDCYYNSLVAYIEEQRAKDKQVVIDLKRNVEYELSLDDKQSCVLQNNLARIQQIIIRTRSFDSQTTSFMNQIEMTLNKIQCKNSQAKTQYLDLVNKQNKSLLIYPSNIQNQFDAFVQYFDSKGKLCFKSFNENVSLKPASKTNALRFSFEKALQNQNRKKSLISDSDIMNPLQEQVEEEYEETSFSQDHMTQTAQNPDTFEQKPFRTLFAEQDDILQNDQEDQSQGKNDMYSPTFKAI